MNLTNGRFNVAKTRFKSGGTSVTIDVADSRNVVAAVTLKVTEQFVSPATLPSSRTRRYGHFKSDGTICVTCNVADKSNLLPRRKFFGGERR